MNLGLEQEGFRTYEDPRLVVPGLVVAAALVVGVAYSSGRA
jgi:hypothetical protein